MMARLWTSEEIADATGGSASASFEATGVSIDTRSLAPGDIFVALKDIRDGHEFVATAFEAGASAALVSRKVEGFSGPLLIVDDVMTALEAWGLAARKRAANARRIAVTGSVGKTSVKEMIARIFRGRGPAHWSVKSFNNHWGVPLTLARMPAETQNAVFEIGMSTPGEIAPRSNMVAPHVSIITRIAPAHLEGLGSIKGVAREKADIAAGLEPGGVVVLPAHDEMLPALIARVRELQPNARFAFFGPDEACKQAEQTYGAASVAIVDAYNSVKGASQIDVSLNSATLSVTIDAVGSHWADNIACALLAVSLTGNIDMQAAAADLSGYAPPPGRGTAEVLSLPAGGQFTLIDDAYNANPASMRAALSGLAARDGGRRLAALGEMLEVGETSQKEHNALSKPVIEADVSAAFLAGRGMQVLQASLESQIESHWAEKADALDSAVKNSLKDGDLLLIKGSNASGMGKLADRLRQWSKTADEQVMDSGPDGAARGRDAV